ncbi:CHAT domain-containing protein [Pseudenhygromyxa sp. WMMC2535]|uniref:CHAT domain-containing protein n=1 Tax=Pseudenhygromyxa sp. WMMC2535 TaxID=2712867 RepID=UPI001595E0F1|nr:CHAT domain-containing protein [Pseudenhygromyxa sp. WMMC2535]NVB39816.1 CHAT domain-containing protein [Pseudenhygromyxa sp. WMMC2535]
MALSGGAVRHFADAAEFERAEQLLVLFVECVPSVGLDTRQSEASIREHFEDTDGTFDYELALSMHVVVLSDYCNNAIEFGEPERVAAWLPYFDPLEYADEVMLRRVQGWRYAIMRTRLALAEGDGQQARAWAERGRVLAVDEVSDEATRLMFDEVQAALFSSESLPLAMSANTHLDAMMVALHEEVQAIEAGAVPLSSQLLTRTIEAIRAFIREEPRAVGEPQIQFMLAWFEFQQADCPPHLLPELRELARDFDAEHLVNLVVLDGADASGPTRVEAMRDALTQDPFDARPVHKAIASSSPVDLLELWPDYLGYLERKLAALESEWSSSTPEHVATEAGFEIPNLEETLMILVGADAPGFAAYDERRDALIHRLFNLLCSPRLRREVVWKQGLDGRPPWLLELTRKLSRKLAHRDYDELGRLRRELDARAYGIRRDAPALPAVTPSRRIPELLLATCGPFSGSEDVYTIAFWSHAGQLSEPETPQFPCDLPERTDVLLHDLQPTRARRGRLREVADDDDWDEANDSSDSFDALVTSGDISATSLRGDTLYSSRFGDVFRGELPEIFGVRASGFAQRVPFAAIVVDERWLGERSLPILLSGIGDPDHQLRPLSDPARSLILALSSYRGALPDLPGTTIEATRIRRALGPSLVGDLIGARATPAAFVEALKQRPEIVHIAVHGVADEGHPERSYLVLAGEGDQVTAVLGFDEITTLDLSKTRLVVLSACSTMVGPRRRSEGIMALSWAFKSAGVDMVIAARWPVVDMAAPDYWASFYAALARCKDVPMAMLTAQRESIGSRTNWDPSIWACYQLIA